MKLIKLFTLLSFAFVINSQIANAAEYSLGPGDVIEISVYQQPDLKFKKTLSGNGEISFPYIGIVNLTGKTEFQTEVLLENKLRSKNFIKSPEVTVSIIEYNSSLATVEGKVATPGEFAVIGNLSLRQLIAKAGGILDGADSRVTLYRKGQPLRIIDLYDIYNSNNSAANVFIIGGDRVLVEDAPVFYTYGEVNKAGRYEYSEGMSVVQALALSGGLTEDGTEKNMQIIRTDNQSGKTSTLKVSLNDKVQANDVIRIQESRF